MVVIMLLAVLMPPFWHFVILTPKLTILLPQDAIHESVCGDVEDTHEDKGDHEANCSRNNGRSENIGLGQDYRRTFDIRAHGLCTRIDGAVRHNMSTPQG